jgi:hypothetical protein
VRTLVKETHIVGSDVTATKWGKNERKKERKIKKEREPNHIGPLLLSLIPRRERPSEVKVGEKDGKKDEQEREEERERKENRERAIETERCALRE